MEIQNIISTISDALWSYILVVVLIAVAIWFTIKSKGVQFRMFKEMIRLLGSKSSSQQTSKEEKKISPFQAFTVSLASSVGTGNMAGVATAIAIGGPGAVFWMWVIAILGAATSFIEATLAQLFKQHSKDSFIGGPAYYIKKGLKNKTFAAIFAILITITFGLSYNSIQSNTICDAVSNAFTVNRITVGWVLAGISLLVIFGGIQRIAKVSSIVVPTMAIGYLLIALYVIFHHINLIPEVFSLIFKDAFGIEKVAGGGIGATIMMGIKRGLFSNEAGEGSAPNVAATASTSHPVKQGLIQALGVFTDTLLVCSCTAFIILFSGKYNLGENGIALTQIALESEIGKFGSVFIAFAIFLFAYSSIIGNYYYGESNIRFLTNNKTILMIFRVLSGGVVVLFGAYASLDLVWSIGDICMALLTLVNIVAITLLGKYAIALLKDYIQQKKSGIKEPEFKRSKMPWLDLDCWE